MSWPRQRKRALRRIEARLRADEPELCSLFARFAQEAGYRVMPPAERIESGLRQKLRWALAGHYDPARRVTGTESGPNGRSAAGF